jgi:hypothetical protein
MNRRKFGKLVVAAFVGVIGVAKKAVAGGHRKQLSREPGCPKQCGDCNGIVLCNRGPNHGGKHKCPSGHEWYA